ncbi:16S rRNA (cytidine(1402)-2'-O)-methyltransferase [Aquicoccus sp. SCR17]|nr:16S rRNA (cytidine(1402)-2'-O)-methyltransferase [Carideicomes alvinocaridis]
MGIARIERLEPGLYFVGTPIGSARDITLRALDVLASADALAAEDTRSMRRLLEIHGVALGDRPLLAYHDHNGAKMRPRLLGLLEQGCSVAYASEAGMPLIADPGFDLGRAAAEAGHRVTCAPGPSAADTALALSGLPTDRFLFAGFLPATAARRKAALRDLAEIAATLVIYESPRRLAASLRDAAAVLGGSRPAAVCRELTKKFEEIRRGTLEELAAAYEAGQVKGEVVVVIGRGEAAPPDAAELEEAVVRGLETLSVKDTAEAVSRSLGIPKREAYQMALKLDRERER